MQVMCIHFLQCLWYENGGSFLLEVARGCERMGYDMQEIDRENVGKVGCSTKIISRFLENRGLNIALILARN